MLLLLCPVLIVLQRNLTETCEMTITWHSKAPWNVFNGTEDKTNVWFISKKITKITKSRFIACLQTIKPSEGNLGFWATQNKIN